MPAEEHVILGSEVAEERTRRGLGGFRDLLNGRGLVPLLEEQPSGCGEEHVAGPALLPLTERLAFLHSCILCQ